MKHETLEILRQADRIKAITDELRRELAALDAAELEPAPAAEVE